MAYTIRKKAPIFSIPSYLPSKKKKMNDKVNILIQEAIQEKIFNLLNINRKIYIRSIEYFISYTLDSSTQEKKIASFNLRIKNKIDKYFKSISGKEIELSGIAIIEFSDYLKDNGVKKIKKMNCILNKI
jgi:hypothetical protein